MEKYLLLFLLTGLLYLPAHAQRTVTGKVISVSDEKPIAATLKFQNAGMQTAALSDGTFHISFPSHTDTLVISHVGFQTKKVVLTWPVIQPLLISLQVASNELETVVVSTGYYQVPKERATGSFTQLNEKVLNSSVSTDIISRLKGVANGITFDERNDYERKFSVRGLSTINGNTQPLIVLNNFAYDGDLNSINPNDVESITVLKDAAAASIWGVRAANGVIVINTRKGRFNSLQEISFNSNLTVGRPPDVSRIPMMNGKDYIFYERYLFDNGFYESLETDPSNPVLSPAVEYLIDARDGKLSTSQLEKKLSALGSNDIRDDFKRYLYKNSLNQQYALSIRGGAEKQNYFYSLGYDHNTDNLGATLSRLSLRADNNLTIGKVKVNPVISFSRSQDENGRPVWASIKPGTGSFVYPYVRLADDKGNPLTIPRDYRTGYAKSAIAKGLSDWTYAPLADYKERTTINTVNDLVAGLNLDYSITPRLKAQVQYQYEWVSTALSDLNSQNSYYSRNLKNRFTQDDGSGNLTFPIPAGGVLFTDNNGLQSHSGRTQLNYSNGWGKHELSILAGIELRSINNGGNSNTTFGYNPSGLTFIPVDLVSRFPQYNNPGDEQGIPYVGGITAFKNRFRSYYANASYNFDQRYILSASVRKDESNIFGGNANRRGVPLWSAGVAWNISNEKFFPPGWLSYLKLRSTYGVNGNLPQNLSARATLMQDQGNYNNQPYAYISSYPNSSLQWEKVSVFNVGLDFGITGNRLTGSIEYYHKKASDLIGTQPIDPTVGIPSGFVVKNVADMKANGWDIQLNSININKKFKWLSTLIMNYNKDEVISYTNYVTSGYTFIKGGYGINPLIGHPVSNVLSFQWRGLDPETGDPIGVVNGAPSRDYSAIVWNTEVGDLKYHGAGQPVYFGNFSNTFSYAGFSLYVNVTYRLGYYFQRPTMSYYYFLQNGRNHPDFALRWQKPGDELHTNVPSLPTIDKNSYERDFFNSYSSALVERADNIRLQDLNLSWSPSAKPTFLPVKDLQFYVYARNLGILWRANKSGIDPDFGVETLAPSWSLSFGLKAKF